MKRIIKTVLSICLIALTNSSFAQGWSWASKSSGTGTEQSYGIQSDASGNNYVTGAYINGPSVIGTTTLTVIGGAGTEDAFLAKTNSAGVFQWAVKAGGTMNDEGKSVATNGTDVFVTGIYRSNVTFYSTTAATATLTGVTTDDECYIARYNSAGVVQWAVKYTGVAGTNQTPRSIAINNALSFIYVTGVTGGKQFTNCYNFSGVIQWSTVSTNTGSATGWGVVSDNSATGNSYAIAQYAAGPIDLGATTYVGTNGALLIKYNSAGVVQWVQNIGGTGTGDEFPRGGLGIDATGNLYVGGDYSGTGNISGITLPSAGTTRNWFLAKYNNAGAVQWAQYNGGTGYEYTYGMSTDASGNCFLGINNIENNSVGVDCQTFPSVLGNTDNKFLVVKYDNTGAINWAGAPVSNNGQTSAWCITNYSNTAIVSGLTIGNTNFGPTAFVSPNGDVYLAKIGSSIPVVSGATICSGLTATLTPSFPTGSGVTFNWYNAPTGGTLLFTGASFTTPILTATTTYYLSVVPGGCSSTRVPVTVTVNPKPTVTVTGPTSICPAYTGTLTASGASTYLWMPGNATGSTLSVSPLVNTTYTVTGTNSFGCTNTATFVVNSSPATNLVSNPDFSVGPTSVIGSTLPLETGNCTAGTYKVVHTFYNKCTVWPATIYDHTSGTAAGWFLAIDNDNATGPQTVWSQKVPVIAGTTYTYSFWSNCLYSSVTHPVKIDMMIGGGTYLVTPAMSPTQEWRQYSCTYTALTTGLVMLNLTVEGLSDAYRDFGIDDIFFGYCANGPVTVNNTSTSIPCSYTVTASVYAVNGSGTTTLLTSPAYAIAAGGSQVYTFTPPAGYWIDYTTLSFSTQTSTCAVNIFGLTSAGVEGNCWNCATTGNTYGTLWDNMGGNVFNIHADLYVGRMANPNLSNNTVTGVEYATSKTGTSMNPTVEVFPNPSNGMFTLNFTGENEKNILVYDMMGNVVFEKENSTDSNVVIDITNKANGVYFVKVVNGSEVVLKKIIKQ